MDQNQFRDLIERYLLPMMPRTKLWGPDTLRTKHHRMIVTRVPGGCHLRPSSDSNFGYRLTRSQNFLNSELKLIECFVNAAVEVEEALGAPFEAEVLQALPLRVVAHAAGGESQTTMLRVLEQFSRWAADQYEGRPISAAVGLDMGNAGEVPLEDVWKESFAPVISNGMDTLVVIDTKGCVASIEAAPMEPTAPSFSPFRFRALAQWATNQRVAVALTRTGEILIFRDRSLQFARRAGVWHHFTHSATIKTIHLPHREPVKTALYETLLDVSFARSGGCVAVVHKANAGQVTKHVAERDLLYPSPPSAQSTKGKLLASAVGADFVALDRRIRAELLALDGATVPVQSKRDSDRPRGKEARKST